MKCHATRFSAAMANIGMVGLTNISAGCCGKWANGSIDFGRMFSNLITSAREIRSVNHREEQPFNFLPRFWWLLFAPFSGARMKAKIIITPKKAVLDPQGKTVQTALEHMGYTGVTGVHIGKYIEIDLASGTDKAAAEKALNDAAHRLLSNPVIEDYKLEIE